MTAFRFIHTSDLHLGRKFGNLPEDVRGRLTSARGDVLRTLSDAGHSRGASHVVIAGDLFDTETPSDQIVRQALNTMGSASDLSWWIIPGNHDSLVAEELWDRVQRDAPLNVTLLGLSEPTEMAAGVTLLPAPATSRFPGRDLTDWMTGASTPDGQLRIGLAHGSVQTFSSEDGRAEIIPPDRAETAGLAYLALGDWHGQLRINDRTHYSGSPERDRFKHAGRGHCLSVTIEAPNALPAVEGIVTGRFDWSERELPLTPGQDPEDALQLQLPGKEESREDILLKLRASGWATMQQRLMLAQAIDQIAPDFCYFEYDAGTLATEYRAEDLNEIDVAGALRLAADKLWNVAQNETVAEDQRLVAEAALNRFYTIVKGDTK